MIPKKYIKMVVYLIIVTMLLSTLIMGVGFFY
ncbi:stressosome-associated protein Prli42 [Ammoniphilus sp. CFH 90114]|nr:stressosome-associated protein Prli42 [Ammoniphilus sp. CFH 90114]